MKKSIVILCVLMVLICGCEKKNDDVKTNSSSTSTTSTTSVSTTTSTTTSTSTTSTTTKTTKTTTTKKTTTTIKVSTTACREKKFDKKYSYAYKTKEECNKQGNLAFLDISDNTNPDVFSYTCRLVKDECGNSWYGVVFYVYNNKTSKEEEIYY